MKYSILVFLLIFYSACESRSKPKTNSVPAQFSGLENLIVVDTSDAKIINFEREQEIGKLYRPGTPAAPSLGFGPKYAVDEGGRVYIANPYEKFIQVYEPDGSLITNIGRYGRGPGDFESIAGIYIRNEELIVFDGNMQRLQFFNIDTFGLVHSFLLDPNKWKLGNEIKYKHSVSVKPLDHSLLVCLMLNEKDNRSIRGYFQTNRQGEQVSGIVAEEYLPLRQSGINKFGHAMSLPIPTSTESVVLTSDSLIFKLSTRDALLEVFDSNGDYLKAFYLPVNTDPVEKEEVLSQIHPNFHSLFEGAEYPEFWPAAETFFVDDRQDQWVATIVENHNVNDWYIMNSSGKLKGTFQWPTDEEILFVSNGKMYTEFEDSVSGDKTVIRYGIKWE